MTGNLPIIEELNSRSRELGLDLREVGRRSGLAETSLRAWERGLVPPPADALERWAKALGFRIALLPMGAGAQHGISVDWQQHRIDVDGAPVRLTPMEWKLLERLAWSPGQLVTHRQLFKHLYGKERDCRAQATAIRVLINKLRRLLPIRIEAQWGQGYVIEGIPAARADDAENAGSEGDPETRKQNGHQNGATPLFRDAAIVVRPAAESRNPPRIERPLRAAKPPVRRAAMALPMAQPHCRAEELGVIERFLAERGVTHCPDPHTIAQSGQPNLVWDKMKRKWIRPRPEAMSMPLGG